MISSAGPSFKMFGSEGLEIDPAKMIREREINAKEPEKQITILWNSIC